MTRRRPGSRRNRSRRIDEKYQQNTDPEFRARCLIIKEQRSELVKHHLWVLWTDYFKPPHFEKYPQLHQLFNEATKLAGAAGTKGSTDVSKADDCWPRSTRSTRSSGRPSRPERAAGTRVPLDPGFPVSGEDGGAGGEHGITEGEGRGGAAYFSARAGGGRLLAMSVIPPGGQT